MAVQKNRMCAKCFATSPLNAEKCSRCGAPLPTITNKPAITKKPAKRVSSDSGAARAEKGQQAKPKESPTTVETVKCLVVFAVVVLLAWSWIFVSIRMGSSEGSVPPGLGIPEAQAESSNHVAGTESQSAGTPRISAAEEAEMHELADKIRQLTKACEVKEAEVNKLKEEETRFKRKLAAMPSTSPEEDMELQSEAFDKQSKRMLADMQLANMRLRLGGLVDKAETLLAIAASKANQAKQQKLRQLLDK